MNQTLSLTAHPRDIKESLDQQNNLVLLDVREPQERAIASIPGSIHIPMREIPSRLDEITEYRNETIVVFCHLGVRSMQVVQFLASQDFPHVKNMEGGIEAWANEIDPEMRHY